MWLSVYDYIDYLGKFESRNLNPVFIGTPCTLHAYISIYHTVYLFIYPTIRLFEETAKPLSGYNYQCEYNLLNLR